MVRRGDLRVAMKMFDEAVGDYASAKEIDPTIKDIEQKLKYSQQETKKAKKKDYYEILGVAKDADDATIKKAYKKMALKYHPDRNCENDEQKEMAAKKFKEINEAMQILGDPQKRKQHDMGASAEDIQNGMPGGMGGFGGMPGGMDISDLLGAFMQGGGMGGMGGMPGGMGGMGGMPGFTFNMGGMPGGGRGRGRGGGGQMPQGFPF